jgi:hypothetical protein
MGTNEPFALRAHLGERNLQEQYSDVGTKEVLDLLFAPTYADLYTEIILDGPHRSTSSCVNTFVEHPIHDAENLASVAREYV